MLFSPPPDASWIETLPDGHQGTWRTLEAMRWLVRKDYKSAFVLSLVRQILRERRPLEPPVSALFFFARDRIRFQEDPPGIERVASFERTTQAGAGDCDDKCVWLATALFAINVPARFVVQNYGADWAHVYLEFYDWAEWKWIALDPSADGHTGFRGEPGWRQPLPLSGSEMVFSI